MRTIASFVSLSLAGLAVWLAPTAAQACSCFVEEVLRWPREGTLAENETIVLGFQGCAEHLILGPVSEHAAFVDDQRVDLVPLADRPGYTLDPPPEEASTVTIVRCGYDVPCELDTVEPDARWDMTVVGAIEGNPGAPSLGPLDYDLVEFDDCGAGIVRARDWTFELTPDSDEPRVYELRVGPEGEQSQRFVFTESTDAVQYIIQREQEDAGKTVCATVRSFDMAGNESPEVSSCYELGRGETLGCACTSSPDTPPGWTIVTLALVTFAARRRSSRRTDSPA